MLDRFKEILGEGQVITNEPMSKHTTFRTGGNAKYFLTVPNEDALIKVLTYCKEQNQPYFLLGNGSNLLVRDEGYDGVIIHLSGDFLSCRVKERKCLVAGAAVQLGKVAQLAAEESWTGLEFAFGIPGTVGGAILMNAGAYGGEMKDVVKEVRILMDDLTIKTFSGEEMQFSYRHSILKEQKGIVLSVSMELNPGDKEEITGKMADYTNRRREKQPLEYPSAGSTFKRPEGHFAGQLIQEAGLKGYRVGGAMVSEKHAGFVINVDHATSRDVLTVIDDVRRIVQEKTGILLEPEVIIL